MCARGLLENPALFSGYKETPIECVKYWVNTSIQYGTSFVFFHQVLVNMLQNVLNKHEKRYFNSLLTTSSVIDYLNDHLFSLG
jgi:tRNA-dihydrouridine synthase 4